jgi:hypothetical protein
MHLRLQVLVLVLLTAQMLDSVRASVRVFLLFLQVDLLGKWQV